MSGIFRKSTTLVELGLGLVLAGDVGEGDLGLLGVVEARPAAAEPEDPLLAALHLAAEVQEEPEISTIGRRLNRGRAGPRPPLTFVALMVTPFASSSGRSAGSPSGGATVVNEV